MFGDAHMYVYIYIYLSMYIYIYIHMQEAAFVAFVDDNRPPKSSSNKCVVREPLASII